MKPTQPLAVTTTQSTTEAMTVEATTTNSGNNNESSLPSIGKILFVAHIKFFKCMMLAIRKYYAMVSYLMDFSIIRHKVNISFLK